MEVLIVGVPIWRNILVTVDFKVSPWGLRERWVGVWSGFRCIKTDGRTTEGSCLNQSVGRVGEREPPWGCAPVP